MSNNKNLFIGVGAVTLLLVGVMWIARPGTPSVSADLSHAVGDSVISSEAPSFDFGTVSMAEGIVTHAFTIENPTVNPVTITQLFTSCMCTSVSLITDSGKKGPFGMPGHGFIPKFKEVLVSNGEAIVQVAFNPAAHGPAGIGWVNRTVYIETEDAASLELYITAVVTP